MKNLLLLLPLLALACGGDEGGSETSNISSSGGAGQGGQGGTTGAGAGGAAAGAGGAAAGAGGAAAGSGGAPVAGTGGSPVAGAGGSPVAGTSSGGTSSGGTSSGGTGGTSSGGAGAGGGDCCAGVTCPKDAPVCMTGSCYGLAEGDCFSEADCGGKACIGATICPCGVPCDAPTTPGKCEGVVDCCATVKCGAGGVCVEGECFNLAPGECFDDGDCGGAKCEGAIVCPCGSLCKQGTKPGTCGGAPAGWKLCGAPGDCKLAAKGCCDGCGVPTVDSLDSVNVSKFDEHFKAVCGDPSPICPECATQQNPDLLAICALGPGECGVVEVSKSPFSACEKDEDCVLRPPSCCYCDMQAEFVVAVSVKLEGNYNSELGCNTVDCAPCPGPIEPPPGVKAACDPTTKHCRVSK